MKKEIEREKNEYPLKFYEILIKSKSGIIRKWKERYMITLGIQYIYFCEERINDIFKKPQLKS